MRTEVHVHGSVFLCKGVRVAQIDQAMRPWLDYLDVDTIADAGCHGGVAHPRSPCISARHRGMGGVVKHCGAHPQD